jgi:hypothetical protein
MYKTSLVQQAETIQELLSKDSHKRRAQAPELVLLDQLVQIDAKQFENQAKMLSMDKSILQSEEMMVVVLIELRIELDRVLAEFSRKVRNEATRSSTETSIIL